MSPLLLALLVFGAALVRPARADDTKEDDVKTYKLASWHVRNFGRTSMEDPNVLGSILQTIEEYHLVFFQGIKDEEGREIYDLREILNRQSFRWKLKLSERRGHTNETKEQYAFISRKDVDIDVDILQTNDEGDQDCEIVQELVKPQPVLKCSEVFEREPFIAKVSSDKFEGLKEFAIIGLYANPKDAVNELNHLPAVVDYVMKRWNIDNVMIMGDLSAGCDYITKEDWSKVTMKSDPSYTWLVSDDEDTVTGSQICAYDRIIVKGQQLVDAILPDSAGAFNFRLAQGLPYRLALNVSDHMPVEVQIKLTEELNDKSKMNGPTCSQPAQPPEYDADKRPPEEDLKPITLDEFRDRFGMDPEYKVDPRQIVEEGEEADDENQMSKEEALQMAKVFAKMATGSEEEADVSDDAVVENVQEETEEVPVKEEL